MGLINAIAELKLTTQVGKRRVTLQTFCSYAITAGATRQAFHQSMKNMILCTKPAGNFLLTGSVLGLETADFLSMGCIESLRHKCLVLRAFSSLVKEVCFCILCL